MSERLTRRTEVPAGIGADVRPARAGIVHLGIGAFHRAHQAVYTQEAMRASGDLRWGIVATTQRSATVAEQLRPQGGRYGVLTVDPDETRLDLVGVVLEVLTPAEDTEGILRAIADPDVHVVTVTVTERGYPQTPAGPHGGSTLDLAAEGIAADLAALAAEEGGAPLGATPAASMVGMLVRGLAERRRTHGAPITVVSCDNLDGNGRVLGRLVRNAVDAAFEASGSGTGAALRAWLDASTAFPSTMVDRIVPATTDAWRGLAEPLLGARDEGLVVAEPTRYWVIEDRFAGPRPPWELAGARFVDDVEPFERAKLRMLNAAHSLIAYRGALAGHETIAEAVADPEIAALARSYLLDEAAPTLAGFDGLDLRAYADEVLARFANPALGHTVEKVGTDGSLKLPLRLLPVAADRLAAGHPPVAVAEAVAAWGAFLVARLDAGEPIADARATELAAIVAAARGGEQGEVDAPALAAGLLDLLGGVAAEHPGFRALVTERLAARFAALV